MVHDLVILNRIGRRRYERYDVAANAVVDSGFLNGAVAGKEAQVAANTGSYRLGVELKIRCRVANAAFSGLRICIVPLSEQDLIRRTAG